MKIVERRKKETQIHKKKYQTKPKKEHVLIVAQEIKFARLLSGNDKKSRDRVLKTLKKWLFNCFQKGYEFKEDDFIRVWKGLFFAVWMSDKPLVQEDLCESIAGILDQFPVDCFRHCLLMVKAGFKVLATEWYGIDHHRMDKYLMLVRRYLRGSLRSLQRTGWSLESCQMYSKMLTNPDGLLSPKTPHYARNALSMILHLVECFLEELSKVSDGEIPEDSLVELLRPFCAYMSVGEVPILYVATRRLLTELMRQSELGLRYTDATTAWKMMGCPRGGPEALELVSDDEETDDGEQNGHNTDAIESNDEPAERPLDPRAGRVNVILQPLPVPADKLASMLREMLAHCSSKAHKRVKICMERFEKLSRDEYPLPLTDVDKLRDSGPRVSAYKSLKALRALEKNLVATSDELALRGLNRKHRKRLLAKARSGMNIVEDVEMIKRPTADTTNGAWKVEPTEPVLKKAKRKKTEKLNQNIMNKTNKQDNNTKKRKSAPPVNGVVVKKKKIDKGDKQGNAADNTDINVKEEKVKKVKVVKDKLKKETPKILLNGETNKLQNVAKEQTSRKNKLDQDSLNVVSSDKVINRKNNDKVKAVQKNRKDSKVTFLVNKVKNFQKSTKAESAGNVSVNPKKVKFVLKNNSMQGPVDYYKSVKQSPSIPFDSSKRPSKTNLKPSTPSPINPFFKKLKNKS